MAGLVLYGTEGDTLMGLTWTWAWIAIVLFILRTVFAAKAPRETLSLFGIRWDYVWVTFAFVRGRFRAIECHYSQRCR